MAEVPEGYRAVSEEDSRKAKVFFEFGRTAAETGNFEYAIEMYLQGLAVDPEEIEAHQALREISLKRKASGGKSLGMRDRMKLPRAAKDDNKQNMLNAERLLAFDPGSTDYMVTLLTSAHKAGYWDTAIWIGPILLRANSELPKPDVSKYLTLKNVYKDLRRWKDATEAAHYALRVKPDDMDLHTELKNLGAQNAMTEGGYETSRSFRDSVRDMNKQQKLMDEEKGSFSEDAMSRMVREAEAEYRADPEESGKLMKLVDTYEKTADPELENRATQLLEKWFEKTRQFRFRQRIGKIHIGQMKRMERQLQQEMQGNPADESLKKDYEQFVREKLEFELKEYKLWSENYPTEMNLRFEVARRLIALKYYDEAIPVLQQARMDPKYKYDAAVLLGIAFLESQYVDEAVETLQVAIDDYSGRGDQRSKEMYYWQGRALENKGDNETAIKRYSQLAQWDFGYRDVQTRIKRLRALPKAG